LRNNHQQPVVLPILSRGKHRSPRRGACFMEFRVGGRVPAHRRFRVADATISDALA
jgi:hypothetical protein